MGNRQSPVATVSGGTQDSQLLQSPTRDFPELSLRSHSPPGEASRTQRQGAPQLTPRSPSGHTPGPGPSPLRAECPPLNPDLSAQDWEDSRVLNAQWGIQTGITWGTLNIIKLWTNTNYLKGNLWSEGTKHGYAKCLINETWSLDWAPLRGDKSPDVLWGIQIKITWGTVAVFYRPGPGDWSRRKEREKEKERAISLGLHGRPIKPIQRTCTAHEGMGRSLEEVLKAPARKWAQ